MVQLVNLTKLNSFLLIYLSDSHEKQSARLRESQKRVTETN